MPIYDLEANITEEDLSLTNGKARQPVYVYVEAESQAGVVELRSALQQFLTAVFQNPTLRACADVEICVFGENGSTLLKPCGDVRNTELSGYSQIQPTMGHSIWLAPILENAISRITSQKRWYRENRISYNKPTLLVFTSGNILDELWQIRDVVARPLRETSVDILPICQNTKNDILKEASSRGAVLQLPMEQAYTVILQEVCNSMERLSRSTNAAYQELTDCLVEGADRFK